MVTSVKKNMERFANLRVILVQDPRSSLYPSDFSTCAAEVSTVYFLTYAYTVTSWVLSFKYSLLTWKMI